MATDMEHKEGIASDDLERGISELEPGVQTLDTTIATPTPKPTQSTAFLDGLRGVAAFAVYLSHHAVWMYGSDDPMQYGFGYQGVYAFAALPFIRTLYTGGSAAVAIFFVLSGFVLSRSPLALLRNSDPFPLYTRLALAAVRRPFRLFLPVVGVTLGFGLCLHLPAGLAPLVGWPAPQETLFAELFNWLSELLHILNPFTKHGVFENWFPYDPPVWTIAIEFNGSMLVFALVALLPFVPARWRAWFLILLGLVLLFLYNWAMSAFVGGIVLAMSDLDGIGSVPKLPRLSTSSQSILYNASLFVGWWLLCQTSIGKKPEASVNTPGWGWLTVLVPPAYYRDEYWRFWNVVGAFMVVFAVLRLRWVQRFFTLPPLHYLGRVSFSLYLLHIPVLWTIGDRVYRLFGGIPSGASVDSWFDNRLSIPDVGPHGISTRFILTQLVLLPVNLLLAEWCTILLDKPSVKVSRWVEARIRNKV